MGFGARQAGLEMPSDIHALMKDPHDIEGAAR